MLRTSFYLTKEALYTLTGQYKNNRLEIHGCSVYALPENSMAKGEILDTSGVKDVILCAKEELKNHCKKVDLLLDNSLVSIRPMEVPKMSRRQLCGFVSMEMSRFRSYKGCIFDYTILERKKKGLWILGGAMKRAAADSYISLLGECGIRVDSMRPALNGLIRLIGYLPELRDQNLMIVYKEDMEHVTLAVFEAGIYKVSNRIFCEGGVCAQPGRKRLIGQITAYYYLHEIKSQSGGMDGVVLCGFWQENSMLRSELLEELNGRVISLEDSSRVMRMECGGDSKYCLSEFCCLTGNLLGRWER